MLEFDGGWGAVTDAEILGYDVFFRTGTVLNAPGWIKINGKIVYFVKNVAENFENNQYICIQNISEIYYEV